MEIYLKYGFFSFSFFFFAVFATVRPKAKCSNNNIGTGENGAKLEVGHTAIYLTKCSGGGGGGSVWGEGGFWGAEKKCACQHPTNCTEKSIINVNFFNMKNVFSSDAQPYSCASFTIDIKHRFGPCYEENNH